MWVAAAALVALTLAAQCASIAMPDMAFLLYAAGRVLDGARLYRDVVEINPPLIVGLNIPIVWLARVTGVSEFLLYRVVVTLALGALLLLCRRLLRDYTALGAVERRYILLACTIALFPLAGEDFGEREHLVLALVLPYLIVVAARVGGLTPAGRDAAAVGALGGLAVALKPHFALAWLAAEAFCRFRRPELRRGPTVEVVVLVGILVLYVGGVVAATPAYVRVAADLGPAYAVYLRDPFYRLLVLAPGAALVLFALLAAFAGRRASRRPDLWWLTAATMAGFFLAGAAQEKGLRYHFYPAFALALVLLAAVAADARVDAGAFSERLYARVSRLVIATLAIVLIGRTALTAAGGGPAERRARAEFLDLVGFVRARAAGEPIAVLSYNIRSSFPLVSYAGVPFASRFPHLWLFAVSYWDELHAEAPVSYRAPSAMAPVERYFFDSVREDLLAGRPRLMLILRPARDLSRNGLRRLHYVQYFGRDPQLATLFAGYELAAGKGEYDVYERVDDPARRVGPPPSAAPGEGDARLARVTEVEFGLLDGELVAGVLVFLGLWARQALAARRGGAPRVA